MGNFIEVKGQNAFVRADTNLYNVCPDGEVRIIVPVGIQGPAGGTSAMNLVQFTVLMKQYNASLLKFPDEASARGAGLVSGDEFIWSTTTDVGIPGDKHILV